MPAGTFGAVRYVGTILPAALVSRRAPLLEYDKCQAVALRCAKSKK